MSIQEVAQTQIRVEFEHRYRLYQVNFLFQIRISTEGRLQHYGKRICSVGNLSNWRSDSVLYEFHVEKGWSPEKIAKKADVSEALVKDYLTNRDLLNADPESESESTEHTCPECGEQFESVDDWGDHHQSEHYNWEVHRSERF